MGDNIAKETFLKIAILTESSHSTLEEEYVLVLVPNPEPNEGA